MLWLKKQCFITIKDHKDDFRSNPKYRLLNPTKSNLGKISKSILQKVNKKIRDKLNLNQWRNSSQVIEWFNNIDQKSQYSFTTFDIKEFYPSIKEELLQKSIRFAKRHTVITKIEEETIFHCRKSLLYHDGEPWQKKEGSFDVTMGSYDGAEVCELVGLFFLDILLNRYKTASIGLYRDDGLAAFKNTPKRQGDSIRKELIKLFKQHSLDLEIVCNLKCVDFLDITFNLLDGTYKPYSKPNNEPLYVHAKSNHPPSILKQIPSSVSKRISNNSSNEELFNSAAPPYENILRKCGYNETLSYIPPNTRPPASGRKRNRKVLWFNPPYSSNVETNVGKGFLKLISKHFPHNHKFSKIFNRNCVKISYSCMENMGNILKLHNSKISKQEGEISSTPKCNCRDKPSCPLDGHCQQKNVLYRADVTTNDSSKVYIGISEPFIKSRIANHQKSFNDRKYEKDTCLSEHIWTLKDQGKVYSIKWSVVKRVGAWNSVKGRCGLCTTEKVEINCFKEKGILINKRFDLVSKCRHQNKYLLSKFSGVT